MSCARLRKRSVLAGLKLAVIARQSQVSRSWASREANAPETGLLLLNIARDSELVERLLHKRTKAIFKALRAEKEYRCDGQVINRRPDYRTRLNAANTTLHLVERHAKLGVRLNPMRALLDESWQQITDALGAEKVVYRNREMITLGPDHWVHRKAAELASEFMEKVDWKHWRAPDVAGEPYKT